MKNTKHRKPQRWESSDGSVFWLPWTQKGKRESTEGGIPHGSGEQENEGALPLIFSVGFLVPVCVPVNGLGLLLGLVWQGTRRGWEHPAVPAVFGSCCQAPLCVLEAFPGRGLVFNGSKSLL